MKNAISDLTEAARGLLLNRRALALFLVIYVALLATLSLFILTREATIKDLLVTSATLIAVPALFFLLQAMCVCYTETSSARQIIRESVAILRKLIVVTVPFIVIGLAFYLILDKFDARFSVSLQGQTPATLAREGETWPRVVISAIRLVTFGMVLPLACIHTWIAIRRGDVRKVLSTFKPILTRAFALRSVETYVVGFAVFGILPYLLIIVRTPSERAWLEISLLGTRLAVAFVLMLIGWVITVGALQRGTLAEG